MHMTIPEALNARTSDKPMLQTALLSQPFWNLGADPWPARITIRG